MNLETSSSLSSSPALIARQGALHELKPVIEKIKADEVGPILVLTDRFFSDSEYIATALEDLDSFERVVLEPGEPTTDLIDSIVGRVLSKGILPSVIIAIGGGAALDSGKAVSVSLTNPGGSANYQGWNLLTSKGIPKIGVPTMLGTGAESSQTAVLLNPSTGLKLGQNSQFVSFDYVLIDFNLTKSVPLSRGMVNASDAYFHAFEILSGQFRNPFSDALAQLTLTEIRKVFSSKDFFNETTQFSLSVASFFGGLALTGGYVGLIHPLSAVIGQQLGVPHTSANVLALMGLKDFYKDAHEEISSILDLGVLDLPRNVVPRLTELNAKSMRTRTLVHTKPLENALGTSYGDILSITEFEKIKEEILRFLVTN